MMDDFSSREDREMRKEILEYYYNFADLEYFKEASEYFTELAFHGMAALPPRIARIILADIL